MTGSGRIESKSIAVDARPGRKRGYPDGPREMCPWCARARQGDNRTGLCDACHYEALLAGLAAQGRAEADRRRADWEARLGRNKRAYDVERQVRHRLAARVTPRSPCPPWADPWALASEALEGVAAIKQALRPNGELRAVADAVAELIKWLAVGPNGDG